MLTRIVVQNPVDTVNGGQGHTSHSILMLMTLFIGLVAAAGMVLSSMGFLGIADHDRCQPMTLNHGTVRGEGSSCASGTIGSRCSYGDCELGYVLQPTSVSPFVHPPSAEAWSGTTSTTTANLPSLSNGSNLGQLQVERQCQAASHTSDQNKMLPHWSGPGGELHCAREWCGEEHVNMYELGLCVQCRGVIAKGGAAPTVVVKFPRTATPVSNVANVVPAGVVVSVKCPKDYVGWANRSCGGDAHGWSATTGSCTPLYDPDIRPPCCCDIPGGAEAMGEDVSGCAVGPPRCPYDCGGD